MNTDNLFDFMSILFNKTNKMDEINNGIKAKHSFMINRFCAIKYPTVASLLNTTTTNPVGIIESWTLVAKQYKKTPGWIYTKTKKSKLKKLKPINVDQEVIDFYCQLNEIGETEFQDALKFNRDELIGYLKKLEKQLTKISKRKTNK